MNKQKAPKGIEWTRIKIFKDNRQVELPGYTWNPTGGCFHGCTWKMPDGSITECYAKTIAERVAQSVYDEGFEHHYWRPHALDKPLKQKEPSGIFVGSMADLFGHWVPEEQIREVLEIMNQANWHIFQTLSKYPVRLVEFNPFPSNVWVGVSIPAGHFMSENGAKRALKIYLKHMEKIQANVRFMSMEPLWFDVASVLDKWIAENGKLPFEWAIIGAASKGSQIYQPDTNVIGSLLEILSTQSIPVFFKGNLDWSPWRDEFPDIST